MKIRTYALYSAMRSIYCFLREQDWWPAVLILFGLAVLCHAADIYNGF